MDRLVDKELGLLCDYPGCSAMAMPGVLRCSRHYLIREAIAFAPTPTGNTRTFETGATRDTDAGKYDYEGFLSPLVIERFAEYMHKHRHQTDGTLRDASNWQKGIPIAAYMSSLWRHFINVWKRYRGWPVSAKTPRDPQNLEEDLCAMLFNVQGYLHEVLKVRLAQKQEGKS